MKCIICHEAETQIGRICEECRVYWTERRGLSEGYFETRCMAAGCADNTTDTVGVYIDLRDEGRCCRCLTLHRLAFNPDGYSSVIVHEPATLWVLDGPATEVLRRLLEVGGSVFTPAMMRAIRNGAERSR